MWGARDRRAAPAAAGGERACPWNSASVGPWVKQAQLVDWYLSLEMPVG